MYILVESNAITEIFSHPKPLTVAGVQHPPNIFSVWSEAELKAIGVYTAVIDTTNVNKQDLVSGTRDYNLPADLMALSSVSILDTKDGNKYKRISRLVFDPLVTEDA